MSPPEREPTPGAGPGVGQDHHHGSGDSTNPTTRLRRLPVHPVAECFPMLEAQELRNLAADIAEHGLHHPVVVQDDVLIDGRNRLAGCEIAGVDPDVLDLDHDVDPVTYILSANVGRRHLNKGQQAITLALVEEIQGHLEHGRKNELSSLFGISARYLQMARTVIESDHRDQVIDRIMRGGTSLRQAYVTESALVTAKNWVASHPPQPVGVPEENPIPERAIVDEDDSDRAGSDGVDGAEEAFRERLNNPSKSISRGGRTKKQREEFEAAAALQGVADGVVRMPLPPDLTTDEAAPLQASITAIRTGLNTLSARIKQAEKGNLL